MKENVYSVFRQKPLSVGFAELSISGGGTGGFLLSVPLSTANLPSGLGTPNSEAPANPRLTKKIQVGAIAGGTIGGLGLIILAVVFFVIYRRRHQQGIQPVEPFTDNSRAFASHPPMKRAEIAGTDQSTDVPVVSDEFIQTERGLQRSPGTFARESPAISSQPSDGRTPTRPGAPNSDRVVLQQLQDLQEQVQQLVEEQSPPRYETAG